MKKLVYLLVLLALVSVAFADHPLPVGVQKIVEHQEQLALSITFLVAFIAGMLTFMSPCGFVVLPTFFAFWFKERKRAVVMTLAFSIGLIAAFALFGLIAGLVGDFFNAYRRFFAVISGVALAFFGLLLLANKGFSFFNFKVDHVQKKSFFSIMSLGFFFGIGWSPCVGPVLGGVLFLAANLGTVINGMLLLIAYGLGVATPLLLLSYASDKYDWAGARWLRGKHFVIKLGKTKIHTHTYNIIAGLLLLGVGLVMMFNKGTTIFMEKIPEFVPWTMQKFVLFNEAILESPFLTSGWANAVGLVVIVLIGFLVYKHAAKKSRTTKFK